MFLTDHAHLTAKFWPINQKIKLIVIIGPRTKVLRRFVKKDAICPYHGRAVYLTFDSFVNIAENESCQRVLARTSYAGTPRFRKIDDPVY